jgi:beta-galactosidase
MKSNLTRRGLLKTGLAASAALITSDSAFSLPNTDVEAAIPQVHAEPPNSDEAHSVSSPREKLLLDFGWRFHLGNANDALKDFRWGAPTREGTYSKAGQNWPHNPADGPLQHSFDDSVWRVVDIPHDWAVELPFIQAAEPDAFVHANHGGKALGREFPETSIGWYERTFELSAKDEGLRISLDFDGVFRDAIVLFNGFYLGRNLSGYAPFSFDVTDYANYGGNNVVTLRVDATLNEGWYYEGAGIYRHTWLTKTHPLHIAKWGTFVRSELREKNALVSIETEILNESGSSVNGRVISRILDDAGKLIATVPPKHFEIPAHGTLKAETQAILHQASLWSIEEPNLYRVVTQIVSRGNVTDHDDVTFGVRSIRFDPNQGFFLNGKLVKIKGTCNHQDHAGVGIAVPNRIHFDRVAALKQMGSNAWRTAHNPVAPEFLEACDRQGMMVMSEVRMMASTPEGLSELESLIRCGRNHPSIIIWSLANEEYFYQGTLTGARIIASMKLLANKLDSTRPVTVAMNGGWGRGMSGVVDVQGFNYWNGEMPDERHSGPRLPAYHDIDEFHLKFPNQPTIGSETANDRGTRGIYESDPDRGYVAQYSAISSDQSSAEEWWSIYDQRSFLSGGFTWTGFDYRGEPGPYDLASINSQTGILDTCGFPKDVYFYYKACWGSEPVLHLFPHWNWIGRESQNIVVRCYSNLDSVELFLNGKSLGSKSIVRNAHLAWEVKYQPGSIEARGSKNGHVVLTALRETTSAPAKLICRPSLSEISADGEDVSAIAVEVHDSSGRIVPVASNKITFRLAGPGRIIGVGNGDPSCREADKPASPRAAERSAFNGLCMAFLQASKQAGNIQFAVSSEGLESATVVIRSMPANLRPAAG